MIITAEKMFADVEEMLRKAAADNDLDYEEFIARVDAAFYEF
jgi:hypothetical protein